MSEHNKKIKAINPVITTRLISTGLITGDEPLNPYYEIQYFDLSDNKWHTGFGSFFLEIVQKNLREYFEGTVPISSACAKWVMKGGYFCCSKCNTKANWKNESETNGYLHKWTQVRSAYCPNCGCKMTGDEV